MKKRKLNEKVYYVKGMHCPSCEILIEKKLIDLPNVEGVEASNPKGKVIIEFKGSSPSAGYLNKLFHKDGYTFSHKPFKDSDYQTVDKYAGVKVLGGFAVAISFFLFLDWLGVTKFVNVDSKSALPAFLLLGIVAGLSSCAALVGGLILSMSKQWSELYSSHDTLGTKLQPHLLFNAGRLVGYGGFGAVLGVLGRTLQLSPTLSSLLVLGVSVMMIILGLQMLGVKYLQRFQFTAPKFITRYVADEDKFKGRYMPFIMGALTFFLPCGFTITAQSMALLSGNALQGSLIMLFFALGTLPMLITIGISSTKFLQKQHMAAAFLKVAGIIVLFFAFFNINNQLAVMNAANLSDVVGSSKAASSPAKDTSDLPSVVNGKQIVKMEASADGYTPNEIRVRAGVPVRWEIKDTGTSGCTNAIIAGGLFDGRISLTPGETSIKEFTPTKVGRYRFSCWMGMVTGTIEVVDAKNPKKSGFTYDETKGGANKSGGGGGCACCSQ